MKLTVTDPIFLKETKCSSFFLPAEIYITESDGHLFKPGDRAILTGLEDFPEFNGQIVEISNIREDGEYGKAYYIKGAINEVLNWTYEYRLRRFE